jgi:hypothetical protein
LTAQGVKLKLDCVAWGAVMKPRQLIRGAAFPPDELNVIYKAFDDAWAEVTPDVSARASAIEAARLSLATIVLSLAKAGHVERDSLRAAAVDAYRFKHRLT